MKQVHPFKRGYRGYKPEAFIAASVKARMARTAAADAELLPQLRQWEQEGRTIAWMARELGRPYQQVWTILNREHAREHQRKRRRS
jgi:hypothetical protein